MAVLCLLTQQRQNNVSTMKVKSAPITKPIIHPIPNPAEFIPLGWPGLGGVVTGGLGLLGLVELVLRMRVGTDPTVSTYDLNLTISGELIAGADGVVKCLLIPKLSETILPVSVVCSTAAVAVSGVDDLVVERGVTVKIKLGLVIVSSSAAEFPEPEASMLLVISESTTMLIEVGTSDSPEPNPDSIVVPGR